MIFAVRITAGRENQVIDKLVAVDKKSDLGIWSVLAPTGVKGYIFMEAPDRDTIMTAVYGISYIKGVVEGSITIKELEHFIEPSMVQINIEKNDIVEVTSGPFRGTKARVTRVNKLKEELVVEPLEAAVPIPITTKLDNIRIIEHKSKKDE